MPRGVRWIKDRAIGIDPDKREVTLGSGVTVSYDFLVVCPGIQLDWDAIPGLTDTLGNSGVSSNYRFDLAPRTWEFLKDFRGGTAVFTHPPGAIKCPGAPQKIAYLAAHWWQQQGVLDDIHVVLVLPTATMFSVPEFSRVLEQVVDRYGIDVRFRHDFVEIDPQAREAIFVNRNNGGSERVAVAYDVLHAVPPQSAPDWIKKSPLVTDESGGYVAVDKHTLQHVRWPDVFALGDAGNTPNSKTGAAIRKQAPVVVKNLLAARKGRVPSPTYDGYAPCPL